MMLLLFCSLWFVAGIVLLSPAFMFLNKSFDCQATGLLTAECHNTVCALPSEQWPDYEDKNDEIKSIAN